LTLRKADGAAALIAILSLAIGLGVSRWVFEGIPHLEDEFAYLWEAHVMADGEIRLPAPEHAAAMLVPFVVQADRYRFGKYPPGFPAALAIGVWAHAADWVNPLLGALAVWLIYRLGSRVVDTSVGLLAAGLTAVSPFFVMLSGTLMSHNLALVLGAAFALAWFERFPGRHPSGAGSSVPPLMVEVLAGLSLGLLLLTRPLTAGGLVLPFVIHGLVMLRRSPRTVWRPLVVIVGLSGLVGLILPIWQAALTGDPNQNLYLLWWPYDKIGFGTGVGNVPGGHNLNLAWLNTRFSLRAGLHDLLGWPYLSWLFLPFGLWALRRSRDGLMLAAVFPSLVGVYGLYWIGSWLFGPRYYYAALPGLMILTAAGINWVGGWLVGAADRWLHIRKLATFGLVSVMVAANLCFYLPTRLGSLRNLYGISRAALTTVTDAHLKRGLIFVHTARWMAYGNLLTLEPPFSKSDLRIAWSNGDSADRDVAASYPGWPTYDYYPGSIPALTPADQRLWSASP
jgi:4-amino-4-deoxy-L-arabinose transferase-like glycosyltransferase